MSHIPATGQTCPTCEGNGTINPTMLAAMLQREPHTRSRSASTRTSAGAAQLLNAETCRKNHMLILKQLNRFRDGLTDEQITRHVRFDYSVVSAGISASTLRARRSELMHADMVKDSGERRKKSDTGRLSAVWQITGLGILVLEDVLS
jgi:hypothetical protein